MDSLHEHLAKDSLPSWLGGELSEDEAFDDKLINNLLSPESELWYDHVCRNKLNRK
jgi:hypothetical protein